MTFPSRFLKTGLFLAVVGGLSACSDSDNINDSVASPDTVVISGKATKGTLSNALVTIYDANGQSLGSSVTDIAGSYTVDIASLGSDPIEYPLQIKVSTSSSGTTTMKCDLPEGCDGVPFGGDVTLDDSFELSALVPEVDSSSQTATANLNAWTTAATQRALALADTESRVLTAADVSTANRETAAILNNLLGLEGTSDAFDEDFGQLPVVSLNSLDSTSAGSNSKQATLLSMANSAIIGLVGGPNTTVSAVISSFSSAFQDGQLDVNGTAVGIDDSALNINLADIAEKISTVASTITAQLSDDEAGALSDLLVDTSLTALANTVSQIASDKEAVTDTDNDPTAPIEVTVGTVSDSAKALAMAVQLDNVLSALGQVFDDGTDDFTGPIVDVAELLELSTIDGLDLIENIGDAIILGAELLKFESLDDGTLDIVGCEEAAGVISCTASQLGALLEDDLPIVSASTGTFTLTVATNTVTLEGLVLDGLTYALTMVGDGADLNSATSLSYQIDSATVVSESVTLLSVGDGSSLSASSLSEESQLATINLVDAAINIDDFYNFDGDILLTQTYLSGSTFSERVLSAVSLSGGFTLLSGDNSGDSIQFTLDYSLDTSTLDPENLLLDFEEESQSNFYKIDNFILSLTSPVEFSYRTVTNANVGTTTSSLENGSFKVIGGFSKPTNGDVSEFTLSFRVVVGSSAKLLTGEVVESDSGGSFVFTNSDTGVVLTITDTDAGTGLSGGITVDGDTKATIDAAGAITVTLESGSAISFQLGIN